MRLIDADKLIDSFYKFFKSYEGQWEEGQPQYWADNMAVVVDDAPTVDAEPIVRCKDCKYFKYGNGCRLQSVDYDWEEQMNADDFCSRGERKCGLD